MIKLTVLACAGIMITSCNNSSDTKTAGTDSAQGGQPALTEGWTSLFDGKTIAGWHRYNGGTAPAWKVSDGVLYLDTTSKDKGNIVGGGDLSTDEEYDNFHFKYEWKIAKGGNSGILFYSHEDTAFKMPYDTGPEMQILDNDGHSDGKLPRHRAGDLYDLIACSRETVKPVGEWNQAEIRCVNGKLDFFLNGENVVSTTMWDDNWNKLVAGSKFKDWKGFGAYKKGHIVLQDHGSMVSFRNLQIKSL